MKIDPITNQAAIGVYKTRRLINHVNETKPLTDEVLLSQDVAAVSSTINKLKEVMDMHSTEEKARIAEIAKLLKSGSYHVESSKVAAKIVDEYLFPNSTSSS
ncbi:MAG: flagellar biosynthesis anti-sigma factor FlgM [Firmicutes bacterium]|nr:flagellar biosynthesis anti-sigma factor FlgM [Bacillota bacterium]